MVGVLGAGAAPALPDLVPRRLQHRLVGGVLPQHQVFDDAEQPLALLLLRLLGREQVRMRRRVVHHLREDHRPRRRQRPPRPPQVQRARVPVADRLLPRAGLVDRLERQGDFDELLSRLSFVCPTRVCLRRHRQRWRRASRAPRSSSSFAGDKGCERVVVGLAHQVRKLELCVEPTKQRIEEIVARLQIGAPGIGLAQCSECRPQSHRSLAPSPCARGCEQVALLSGGLAFREPDKRRAMAQVVLDFAASPHRSARDSDPDTTPGRDGRRSTPRRGRAWLPATRRMVACLRRLVRHVVNERALECGASRMYRASLRTRVGSPDPSSLPDIVPIRSPPPECSVQNRSPSRALTTWLPRSSMR